VVVLLTVYAVVGKRLPVTGNLMIALVTGVTFLYPAFADSSPGPGDVNWAWVGAVLGAMFHLAREILKDAEDLAGDTAEGVRTMAALLGPAGVRLLVVLLLFAVADMLLLAVGFCTEGTAFQWISVVGFIVLMAVPAVFSLRNLPGSGQRGMKFLMPLGLVLLLILRYTD